SSVAVTVFEVNDAPTANPDSATVAEDSGATTINVAGNDSTGPANESGQTLTVTAASALHGTVTFSGGNVIYTPNLNYNGPDTITYTISDNGTTNGAADPKSASSTVAVTVRPVNDDPDANNDSAATTQSTPVTIPVLANDSDVDGDTLVVSSTTNGAHGSVTNGGT